MATELMDQVVSTEDVAETVAPGCGEIIPEELGWKGWVVMATLVGGFLTLIRDLAGPDFVMVGMLSIFMALRIVTVEQGL